MTGRTPAEVVNNFIDPLNKALSCVTSFVCSVGGGYYISDESHSVSINRGNRVRLNGVDRVSLTFGEYYRIVDDIETQSRWRVITTGYSYALDDAEQREIIAFHWHPDRRSPIMEPHLHLGSGARIGYDRLHQAHIPTGQITIQDVLKFAITDLGVEPLIDREAALQVLADTRSE